MRVVSSEETTGAFDGARTHWLCDGRATHAEVNVGIRVYITIKDIPLYNRPPFLPFHQQSSEELTTSIQKHVLDYILLKGQSICVYGSDNIFQFVTTIVNRKYWIFRGFS